MGTRNLTVVYIDGKYKVAQYGQWDGYPEGQGVTVFEFARSLNNPIIMEEFKRKVRASSWIGERKIKKINSDIDSGKLKEWQKVYPELSRDTCAKILNIIMERDDGISLQNDIDFAADSLFCEWAWLIDLDAGTFEGYRGFNDHTELKEDDRFYFLRDKERGEYHCIMLAHKWKLSELPSDEDFFDAFREDEDEAV